MADRAGRLPYAEQAVFAGDRYVNLFTLSMNFILGEDGGPVPGGIRRRGGGGGGALPPSSTAGRGSRSILKPSSLAVSFEDPILPPPTPQQPPPPAAISWPYFSHWQYPPQPYSVTPPYAATPPQPPQTGAVAWPGYGCPLGRIAAGGPMHAYSPPAVPAFAPAPIKQEPGGVKKRKEKETFSSQPTHAYVSGTDCAVVPDGEVWMPLCHCGNAGALGFGQGPHATWDCPLRYIQKYGRCPCFLLSGQRDASQWLAGNILTRAAKDY